MANPLTTVPGPRGALREMMENHIRELTRWHNAGIDAKLRYLEDRDESAFRDAIQAANRRDTLLGQVAACYPDRSDWPAYIGTETPPWLFTALRRDRIELPELGKLSDTEFLQAYLDTFLRLRADLAPDPLETA